MDANTIVLLGSYLAAWLIPCTFKDAAALHLDISQTNTGLGRIKAVT